MLGRQPILPKPKRGVKLSRRTATRSSSSRRRSSRLQAVERADTLPELMVERPPVVLERPGRRSREDPGTESDRSGQ